MPRRQDRRYSQRGVENAHNVTDVFERSYSTLQGRVLAHFDIYSADADHMFVTACVLPRLFLEFLCSLELNACETAFAHVI